MSVPESPSSELVAALRKATEAASAAGCRAVLYGGIAAGLRGRARFTRDVDLAVGAAEEDYPALLRELSARGASVPPTALERMKRDGMLPVWIGGVRVDLLFPADPLTASVIADAPEEEVFGIRVGVARAEDLVVLKLLPRRPQDITDIQAILVANRGKLDLARIRRWLPEIEAYAPGATEFFEQRVREFHDPL